MKFTVVVPTRERCETLGATLQSCLDQDHPDLEVIVSDNASLDDTRAVVETDVKIGATTLRMEITLTDRTDMGVAMLLGRSSIGHDFLVHPTKTNILSARKRKAP